MQMGSLSKPSSVYCLILLLGRGQVVHAVGAVDLGGDGLDLLLDRHVQRVEELEVARLLGRRDDGLGQLRAACAALRPDVADVGALGARRQRLLLDHLDLPSVSSVKRLIATTTGTPNSRMFSICLSRLAQPSATASRFSSVRPGSSGLPATTRNLPPCILSARMVQTITTALGTAARCSGT